MSVVLIWEHATKPVYREKIMYRATSFGNSIIIITWKGISSMTSMCLLFSIKINLFLENLYLCVVKQNVICVTLSILLCCCGCRDSVQYVIIMCRMVKNNRFYGWHRNSSHQIKCFDYMTVWLTQKRNRRKKMIAFKANIAFACNNLHNSVYTSKCTVQHRHTTLVRILRAF